MKKTYLTLITLLMVSLLVAACGNSGGNGTSGSGDNKVLRVGATGQSYPNSYKDGDKLVGFDVEVIEAVAERLGYTTQWVNTDFSGLMGQLETGKIDTIANAVALTEERQEKFDFSDPYSYVGVSIVTHTDNTDINTLEDLKGKTVSGVLGSQNVKNLQNYDANSEINVRTYENRDGAQNDALNKRVDGYVNSRNSLLAEIEKNDLPLKFVGDPFHYESVAFPFVKNEKNAELVVQINEALAALQEEGVLTELSEKYFAGEDVTQKVE